MSVVAVSGAAGFVGANLTRRLIHDGHEVHVLVRPSSDLWRLAGLVDAMTVHAVSLDDEQSVSAVVHRVRPRRVFHLAAHGGYSTQRDVRAMVGTNIVGTVNLVQASLAADVEVFVNTGSSSEYGLKPHAPREDESIDPSSHYAVTKASATLFCRLTGRQSDMRVPTLRLYSVYGPYEEPTRLLPTIVLRGLRGELPPLAGPSIARDFVHVDDVVEAYVGAASARLDDGGAVYNVGTGVQTSLADVVALARRILPIVEEPSWGSMPSRAWDTDVWVANSDPLRRDLQWTPRYEFAEGFQAFARWFQSDGGSRLAAYRDRTLPPSS